MNRRCRTISAFITLSLILSLAACGEKNVSGSVTTPTAKTKVGWTNTAEPTTEEAAFETGSTQGGVYTNNFIGIGCQLDENWSFYNEEQLADLNGLVLDAMDDEALSEQFAQSVENGKTIYDMCAVSADGLANINIVIENLGLVLGTSLDESGYVDLGMQTIMKSFDSIGASNVSVEKISVEFAGASRSAFSVYAEQSDVPLYEKGICIKQDKYMAIITICSYYEDITDDLAALFYSL